MLEPDATIWKKNKRIKVMYVTRVRIRAEVSIAFGRTRRQHELQYLYPKFF